MCVDNYTRAGWAKAAVDAFQAECRTDRADVVGDLITDLLHFARRAYPDCDPAEIAAKATRMFQTEEKQDGGPVQCIGDAAFA